MAASPILVECLDDAALVPVGNYHAARFADVFKPGEKYKITLAEDRSRASHNHYFACIKDAHDNLPEDLIDIYPTTEVLRKKMLIRVGYADERSIVCASKAQAQAMAAFIKPMDDYAIVIARECAVTVYTAKSQSVKAMGRATFQDSKDKVLDAIADLIGVTKDELTKNAGMAA